MARCLGGLLLLCAPLLAAAELNFSAVTITLAEDDHIMLDAQLRYRLNDATTEALESGVPLTFETRVEMDVADARFGAGEIVEKRLRSVLRYRPLSALYEVQAAGMKDKQVFATRASALRFMGKIRDLALVERSRLDAAREYVVRLTAQLEIAALPLPMRLQAWFSPDWRIAAEPWEWRLKP